MRPYRKAIETIAVPWAAQQGFSRASAHVFHRPANVPGIVEVIEIQKSCKHPHRTFTINLGLYHPSFTTDPSPSSADIASIHCARCIRIGHVMPKHFWSRLALWFSFGSGWHCWQLIPGDFWWAYRDTDDSLSRAMSNALSQVTRYGLPWFEQSASLHDATEVFDRSRFSRYESAGFFPQPHNG